MEQLSCDEMDRVLHLSPKERYEYTVQQIVERREVYLLKGDDDYAATIDSDGHRGLCIWPCPEFARLMQRDDWESCELFSVVRWEFIDQWLPGMQKVGYKVIVFRTPSSNALSVDPGKFGEHILALSDETLEEAAHESDVEGDDW